MMLLFGIRSYGIKRFISSELELNEEYNEDFTIELRQFYFHIFLIPIIGLGKEWVLIKNEKSFELPSIFKEKIQRRKVKIKRPWYKHLIVVIGPILILLFGLGLYSTVLIQKYQNHLSRIKNIEVQYERITNPKMNDYYLITNNEAVFYILKIDSITIDSILFSVPIIETKDNKGYVSYDESYIDDTLNKIDKIWIERSTIEQTYGGEYNYKNKFNGIQIEQLRFLIEGDVRLLKIRRRDSNMRLE